MQIEITGPIQATPGQEVSLEIKTDPNSYIGLLGVDQSMLLLKSGNDLEFAAILNDLRNRKPIDKHYQNSIYPYPGERSGLVVMTNAHFPYECKLSTNELLILTIQHIQTYNQLFLIPKKCVDAGLLILQRS